jgi:hypothetical protein
MSDRKEAVLAAMREAKRFLERGEELMERLEMDHDMRRYFQAGVGSKEMGAVKRASMDLTRALVEVRK